MLLSPEKYDNWYYTKKGRYISGLEKEVLLKLVTRNLKLETCLDIGCGTGYFTQYLGNYCGSIVGVDTSIDMIKYAMKKIEVRRQKSEAGIKYIVADAENLPFKNGSFDISVSMTAVNFFKNPAKSVSEAVRVSKGGIFLGVLNKWSILSLFKKIKGLFKETTYSDVCFYSQREIVDILSIFPQIKGVQKGHTYFLPFPKIHSILSGIEKAIPSWLPFGGFMGISGEIKEEV